MDTETFIERLNAHRPPFLEELNGRVVGLDEETRACTLEFDVSTRFCHSGDVVQGGFVTAMLDATMTHAAFALGDVANVLTLEIKVSFLLASRAGQFRAEGRILRAGRSTAFMTGELYNADGELTATATTTAKLVRAG